MEEPENATKEFNFLEAFKNMYVPVYEGRKIPYKEAVKCLESLSYEVVTTEKEYTERKV